MEKVAIALGSNLGDSLTNLQSAREQLCPFYEPDSLRQASLYLSKPINCPAGSPDFINTVITFNYPGTSDQLLEITQAIEEKLGRNKGRGINTPRQVDLDILFFGATIVETTRLTIPHPRISSRRFVLEPLAELEPELILPNQQVSIKQLLDKKDIQQQTIYKTHNTW